MNPELLIVGCSIYFSPLSLICISLDLSLLSHFNVLNIINSVLSFLRLMINSHISSHDLSLGLRLVSFRFSPKS